MTSKHLFIFLIKIITFGMLKNHFPFPCFLLQPFPRFLGNTPTLAGGNPTTIEPLVIMSAGDCGSGGFTQHGKNRTKIGLAGHAGF